jgi:hypothetical protein
MNVEKLNRMLLYSWLVIGTSLKNLAIGDLFFFSQNLADFGVFFSSMEIP